eukprot:gene15076-biopygen9694
MKTWKYETTSKKKHGTARHVPRQLHGTSTALHGSSTAVPRHSTAVPQQFHGAPRQFHGKPARGMRISCVGGGSAGPACPLCVCLCAVFSGKSGFFEPGFPLVSAVRTPLRALSKRRKRRCNAPALRFPTSVLRFHLRRLAHPSGGHLAAWGPGPGGLGRLRWPAKNHEIHLIRHGQTKKVGNHAGYHLGMACRGEGSHRWRTWMCTKHSIFGSLWGGC